MSREKNTTPQNNLLTTDVKQNLDKSPKLEETPALGKDRARQIRVMDDMFKTSGVFAKNKKIKKKKKSKYWGADELMALMGSVSQFKKENNDSCSD